MGQVRHGSATITFAVRAAIMRACPPLVRGLARMIESFARAAEPGTRHQPEDGGEVTEAGVGRGYEAGNLPLNFHPVATGAGS